MTSALPEQVLFGTTVFFVATSGPFVGLLEVWAELSCTRSKRVQFVHRHDNADTAYRKEAFMPAMKRAITTWSQSAVFSILALACSHEKSPPAVPSPAEPRATLAASTEPAKREEQRQDTQREEHRTTVSESIARQCNLPDTPENSPHFDFDESALRPRGMGILEDVAKCMQNGPLKDKRITVTGYADPRGTKEYNFALGTRRAVSARDYLLNNGVPSDLIEVRSRGEIDATGTDEASWQLDRRVEVVEAAPSEGR